jgi:hypothetical protein
VPAELLQMRQRRLDDPERRIDVGLHGGVEIFRGHIHNGIAGLLARGVVDDDVEAAEALARTVDPLPAEFFVAQIAGDRKAMRPSALISSMTSCASGPSVGNS